MADQSVVSVVALEVSDGKEREFLALTGQLQALVRNRGYGTNQLLQDGSHPRRYYDIRIWRNADAAAKAEGDKEIDDLRRDLAKHLHATPLVDVAWAVEVGLAAAGPWQERRRVTDRRAVGERRMHALAFNGPDRRNGSDRRIGPRRGTDPLNVASFRTALGNSPEASLFHAARIARERA
ncbi:MAG: hypothetical protein ABW292_13015, partial [Vicinamibacterales bacterium]